MILCAALLVCGAALSALTINNDVLRASPDRPVQEPECKTNCAVGCPPLEPGQGHDALGPGQPAQPAS